MKHVLTLLTAILAALSVHAQELKPLPDMSSSRVPITHDAEGIVLKHIMSSPDDGLYATESVVAKLSFILGVGFPAFGKKGDRIWQVHRVSFAETTSIIWVNAETEAVQVIYPQNNSKAEPTSAGDVLKAAPGK